MMGFSGAGTKRRLLVAVLWLRPRFMRFSSIACIIHAVIEPFELQFSPRRSIFGGVPARGGIPRPLALGTGR
jgi:hypothetical protein